MLFSYCIDCCTSVVIEHNDIVTIMLVQRIFFLLRHCAGVWAKLV